MLTKGQEEALKRCIRWFNNPYKQVFRIYGSAGSGKSHLVGEIIRNLNLNADDVALCAPTGKATTVLMQRFGFPNTSTLHHLIYIPYTKDKLIVTSSNEIEGIESSTEFSLKPSLGFKLIVLDEVSMVDKYQMQDLMSYGIPIIAVGDPYQLPPINDTPLDPNGADALLTEIVRQESDNPIVTLANDVRLGKQIAFGNYNDKVIVLPKSSLSADLRMKMMLSANQVICGMNVTRRQINASMRAALNMTGKYPISNDKIICKSNEQNILVTSNINLCNGMIGRCMTDSTEVGDNLVRLSFKPDIGDTKFNFIADAGVFNGIEYVYDPHWLAYRLKDKYVAKKKILPEMAKYDMSMYVELVSEENNNKNAARSKHIVTRFDFAYCISCHASQGSEFDDVVVIDESKVFRQNASRWLYTAMTRAKKRLILIR